MDCCTQKQLFLDIFSMAAVFLICCYPWAHLEGGGITKDEITEILINVSTNVNNGEQCNIRITNESARFLDEYFDDPDDLIMYLNIRFDNEGLANISTDDDVVLPLKWIWTYGKGRDYLNWPQEYFIWSFGFLNSETPDIPVTFTLVPRKCNIHYGHMSTTLRMAYALSKMVETYLHPKPKHFKGSSWCYTTVVKDRNADTLVRNFGYFVGQFGYKCCNISKQSIVCFDQVKTPDPIYTIIPFYIAFVAMLVSPLLYSYLIDWVWVSEDVRMVQQAQQSRGYTNLSDKEWIFFGKISPISFFSCIVSFIDSHCPECLCKVLLFIIKIISCILIFPACIYIKLFLYKYTDHVYAYLVDKMNHNLPVGFSAMLFSLEHQLKNFLTLTGGPCIMLTVVFFIWLLYLILEEFISKDESARKSAAELLGLDNDSQDSFCNTIIRTLSTVFKRSTWVEARSNVRKIVNNIFNIIPLIFAFRLILARVICYGDLGKVSSLLVIITTGTACCYVLFAFCAIFIASFEFLTLIITFLYMAVVKYPDVTGGYIALVIGVVYIIFSSLRSPAHKYLRFLQLVTESLKYVANVEIECEIRNNSLNLTYFEPNRIKHYALFNNNDDRTDCVLIRNTVVVWSKQNIDTFCINGIHVNLTKDGSFVNEQTRYFGPHIACLKYSDGKLAIYKQLFLKLVHELKPVNKTMTVATLKAMVSGILLVCTASLVKQLHQVSHINSISSVVTAYIIVKIPQLITIIVKDTDPEIKKHILKERIKYETFKYMNALETNEQLPNTT